MLSHQGMNHVMKRASAIVVCAFSAAVLAAACSPEEVKDEVSNHIVCDQVCEWAVDCGRSAFSTFEACDDDCEDKADASEAYERAVEDCAACIDHDDLTCEQNEDICAAECMTAAPLAT